MPNGTIMNKNLLVEAESLGLKPADSLQSIVLLGGKGTRLSDRRKRLDRNVFPHLDPRHYGTIGPKALALLTIPSASKTRSIPASELHLDIHATCDRVCQAVLALGYAGDIVREHFLKAHHDCYRGLKISYLIEERPAGTLAPIVKMYLNDSLPEDPIIYANGDNIFDVDLYEAYIEGCCLGLKADIPLDYLVIDLAALVPWEQSDQYGILQLDAASSMVVRFREKAPITNNPFIEIAGVKVTPVNSGFSIIVNPKALFEKYLSPEIVSISTELEQGALDYKQYETQVKYETLYGKVAADGFMIAIPRDTFWADLGTEEKIAQAEKRIGNLEFVQKTYCSH